MTKCNICGFKLNFLFSNIILYKYEVKYFQCGKCNFIQTETPYWLEEAYATAITNLDIGLISRNQTYAQTIEDLLIKKIVSPDGIYLDYGGGYGMFVRMMRDKGFNFLRQDIHCENLFARHFDLEDLKEPVKFNLLTAFEVFEHLENPLEEIIKMLLYADCIIFSTLLQPEEIINLKEWWYVLPETGQHIALYHYQTLRVIAEKLSLILYSNKNNLHILSKEPLPFNPFAEVKKESGKSFFDLFKKREVLEKKESLLQKDFEFMKSKINK